MSEKLSASARKVQDALRQFGVSCQVVELPGSTRTSKDAAEAVGCKVEQIAKSIVFQGKQSGKPILVVASGSNRIDEKKLRDLVSEPVKKGDADFVRRQTGFVIGGVPPVGHVNPLDIFIDEDLLKYDEIWAAAGTPHAVFKLTPGELVRIARGKVVNIAQRESGAPRG
jgi:prolyl-tRNA editing enzyme YbaK/EbsC (Cys-tRNA(Pro) deacylase)